MLNVTLKAREEIARFFEENDIRPIRVFMSSGCCGSQIALGLDDAKPEDRIFNIAGIEFLVDKGFLAQAQPIEIDFGGNGFKISTALESQGGCGDCGPTRSCCG